MADPLPDPVWTAMLHRIGHPPENLRIDWAVIQVENDGDPAHALISHAFWAATDSLGRTLAGSRMLRIINSSPIRVLIALARELRRRSWYWRYNSISRSLSTTSS